MSNLDLDLSGVNLPGTVPDGDYTIRCDMAELKDTKSGTGKYINCKFIVEETGDFVYHMFNIINDNNKAKEIGLRQLKQFAEFGGHATPENIKDTLELCGLRCGAHIKNKQDDFSGTIKPKISSFKKLS